MKTPLRYALTAAAFLVALVGVGAVSAVIAIVFAGPHSDLLPMPLQVAVYVLCWAAILVLPFIAASAAWRRTGTKLQPDAPKMSQ